MVCGQVHIAPNGSRVAYGPSLNQVPTAHSQPPIIPSVMAVSGYSQGSYGPLPDLRSVTQSYC